MDRLHHRRAKLSYHLDAQIPESTQAGDIAAVNQRVSTGPRPAAVEARAGQTQ
jgi:hypothetical protein